MTPDYLEPSTIEAAAEALAERDDAVALAGGTSVALLLRQGLVRPSRIVGLRRLGGLRGIVHGDGWLRIGALTTHHDIEASPDVRSRHPALADAFAAIATIRIRNQATVGGNLAHADPAQDPPPMLIALDAVVDIVGPNGTRRAAPVDALFADYLETTLAPGELIVAVRIPDPVPGTRAAYRKFLPRSRDDYATVAVGAALRRDDDGRVAHARVALGGVGPTPIRAAALEAALLGEVPAAATLSELAELVRDAVDPLDDVRGSAGYKRDMAVVWVRRVLEELVA